MGEIGPVGKNQRNKDQNYDFRGIDDIFNAVNPAFVKNEVSLSFFILDLTQTEVTSRNNARGFHTIVQVRYRFGHSDGSYVVTETFGESVSYDDKGVNKALQAALKYALLQMFLIPVDEPEADHEQPEEMVSRVQESTVVWTTKDQMDYLHSMAKNLDADQKKRAKEKQEELGIESLTKMIPVEKWTELMEFIEEILGEPFEVTAEVTEEEF